MREKIIGFLPDRPIAFNRDFVRLGIGINGALMLSQALYWAKRTRSEDGTFWKTQQDWENETGLTKDEQKGASKKLIQKGFIEIKKRGLPARNHYQVNEYALLEALSVTANSTHQSAEIPPTGGRDSHPHSITESTTESTTEIDSLKNQKIITTGDKYHPDHNAPKKRKSQMTRTEKQQAAFAAMLSITYFREKADENEMEYFKEEDNAANSRFQKQAKDFEKRYRNNWKEVIDWWWNGEGDWANFHPSNFFTISTYMKFDNRNKGKKKGGERKKYA